MGKAFVRPEEVQAEIEQRRLAQEEAAREAARKAEEKRVADLAAQGLNPDGSPMRPEWQSMIDPSTGLLKSPYQLDVGTLEGRTIDPSKLEGLGAFKKEALREGPSQWAQLQQKMLEQQRIGNLEQASRQAASGTAAARGSLAMRGGLSSGARERLAASGARGLLEARQGIGRESQRQGLQLLSTDEANRLKMLSQLPGFETDIEKFNVGQQTGADRFNIEAQAKAKEYNIGAALREAEAKRAQELDVYKEQQKKWAAEREAQATESSGGGGK